MKTTVMVLTVMTALVLGACSSGDPVTGSLSVTIGGLPSSIAPDVAVSGPGGYNRTLSGSETLQNLIPGLYTVSAETVTSGDNSYSATVSGSPASVVAGGVATASVTYARDEPDSEPDPDPNPDPGPNPAPDPAPDPSPGPDPDPAPDPGPAPDPDPDPDPAPDPDPDPFGTRRAAEIISASEPPTGLIRVGEHLTVEFVGKGTLIDEDPELPEVDEEADPGDDGSSEVPAGEAEYGQMAFHVFNPATGNEFRLTFEQPLLHAVHAFQDARGFTDGTEGLDNPEEAERPGLVPQGWSNGTDNRIMRTATTSWPWRTISQFGNEDSGCTGTLIGPRHLITAAHCINRRATNTWFAVQVDPGRNGLNDSPYGSSIISLNPPPGTAAWYFTPAPWRSSACAGENYKCAEWDWGMIVIPDRLGDLTGWMGYWAGPASYLNARTHYNRGYPKCDTSTASKPALCDTTINGENVFWARLFGDTNSCKLGSYHNPGPDGWNRVIRHSCDTSGGHSGSSVYHYRYNQAQQKWVPVVSMVHNSTSCQVCDSSEDYPNRARRITPGDLGIISWLRNAFP